MGEDRAPRINSSPQPCPAAAAPGKQRKERQAWVVSAITSSLPCSIYRDFSCFLPRGETLIHGPKQEHPAPKGLLNHPSLTLAAPVAPLKDHMICFTEIWSHLVAGSSTGKIFPGKVFD